MQVLVIEDDSAIGRGLRQALVEAGHECLWTKDGAEGLDHAASGKFDVVILDLMLPGLPGLEVLAKLRAQGIRTPVIALTALGSVEDRVAGLRAGADDYMVKPFAVPELLARIDAVARRTVERPAVRLEVAGITLDLATRRVSSQGKDIELTPTEFSLLEFLMRHAGQVVTRKMLYEHLWEVHWEGTTNVIEVHVNRLRNKLDKMDGQSLIQTVRGRGYVFRSPE